MRCKQITESNCQIKHIRQTTPGNIHELGIEDCYWKYGCELVLWVAQDYRALTSACKNERRLLAQPYGGHWVLGIRKLQTFEFEMRPFRVVRTKCPMRGLVEKVEVVLMFSEGCPPSPFKEARAVLAGGCRLDDSHKITECHTAFGCLMARNY